MRKSFLHHCFYVTMQYVVGLYFLIRFSARYFYPKRVPKSGPVLIVANHESFLDPPLLGVGTPRMCNFMARETLFSNATLGKRLFTLWIRMLNAYPVSLEGSGLGGVKQTLKRLKDGEAVVIFPEGTRSDGELLPFHAGFISLAKRAKAAIVPCGISGAGEAMPRGQKPRWGCVTVMYGEPIMPDVVQEMPEQELLEMVETRVRALIVEASQARKKR